MKANLFDKNIVRVLSYFLISPGSKYKRKEIKEKTEMNNLPLDAVIHKLIALKILKEKNKLYALNFENNEIQTLLTEMKKEYDEFHLPHKIFNILIEISERIIRKKSVLRLILFGSYAKLIYTNTSDIDIAVICSDALKHPTIIEKEIKKDISNIEKKHKQKVEVHLFLEKDLKREDPLIKDIIRNGKTLF